MDAANYSAYSGSSASRYALLHYTGHQGRQEEREDSLQYQARSPKLLEPSRGNTLECPGYAHLGAGLTVGMSCMAAIATLWYEVVW